MFSATNSHIGSVLVGVSLLLAGGFGCNSDTAADASANSRSSQRTGNLQAHFEAGGPLETSCGTVTGVGIDVQGPGDAQASCNTDFLSFNTSDGTTDYDHVADCFFVVRPGWWEVETLSALDANGDAMQCCTSQLPDPVLVGANETSEVIGSLSCDVDQNGALDVVVTINLAPVITDLTYNPSKFGSTCNAILLHAEAQDSDGGVILYSWEVIDSPIGSVYELQTDGSNASFATTTLGDYEVRVTATDDQGASSSLDFPIHIIDDTDQQCDLDGLCRGVLP